MKRLTSIINNPRRSNSIRIKRLRGRLLLSTGKSQYELNSTGEIIWKLCDGEKTIEDIANIIAVQFNVPLEDAYNDCISVVTKMVSMGMILK